MPDLLTSRTMKHVLCDTYRLVTDWSKRVRPRGRDDSVTRLANAKRIAFRSSTSEIFEFEIQFELLRFEACGVIRTTDIGPEVGVKVA